MGTHDVDLLDSQPAHFPAKRSCHPCDRHHLASYYVLWLASLWLPRAQRFRSGTPLVETGALLADLIGRDVLYQLIYCFSFTRV